jgi:hypothetical protein
MNQGASSEHVTLVVSSAGVDPHHRSFGDDPSDRVNWVSPKSPALRKAQCRLLYLSQSEVCFAEKDKAQDQSVVGECVNLGKKKMGYSHLVF